jgi:hypothetical protein
VHFPQLADGGGYNTTVFLMNTSSGTETGTLRIFADDGSALSVHAIGAVADSSFTYTIPANGTFLFETDGSAADVKIGWIQVSPTTGAAPSGAAVFRLSQAGVIVTESGVPAATPTTRARIYIDKSAGHDTGIAISNPTNSSVSLRLTAFQTDGTTPVDTTDLSLTGFGHRAAFVGQLLPSLPEGFTGVLEISSPLASAPPFVALTLRSLSNARGEFLLTTFPVADLTQSPPQPIVFPQIADGGGYTTQLIMLSPSGPATIAVSFLDDNGLQLR